MQSKIVIFADKVPDFLRENVEPDKNNYDAGENQIKIMNPWDESWCTLPKEPFHDMIIKIFGISNLCFTGTLEWMEVEVRFLRLSGLPVNFHNLVWASEKLSADLGIEKDHLPGAIAEILKPFCPAIGIERIQYVPIQEMILQHKNDIIWHELGEMEHGMQWFFMTSFLFGCALSPVMDGTEYVFVGDNMNDRRQESAALLMDITEKGSAQDFFSMEKIRFLVKKLDSVIVIPDSEMEKMKEKEDFLTYLNAKREEQKQA